METISVLTLNCWGVFTPMACEKRYERLTAISAGLSSGVHDIIFLQEIWTDGDFERMKTALKKVYPYSNYYHSKLIGSGCCIFTKFPIRNVFFYPYSLNGYPQRVYHGDWFGGKGAGMAQIVTNQNFRINLYVTHFHARYAGDHSKDDYSAHRVGQAYELSQFIRLTSSDADAIILGGDLNVTPDTLSYQLIKADTGLMDAWLEQTNPPDNPEVTGATCDRPDNCFASPRWQAFYPDGERLDYILYRSNQGVDVSCTNCYLTLQKIPNCNYNYSDHAAVAASLQLQRRSGSVSPNASSSDLRADIYTRASKEMDIGLSRVSRDQLSYAILFVLLVLACLLISPLTLSWLPLDRWMGVLAGILVFCLAWGGLVGKVSERRALTNVKQSIRCALEQMTGNGN